MALTLKILEYQSTEAAESGTTATTLKITAHDLETGDLIVNKDRTQYDIRISKYVTKSDADTLTMESISGQTSGDDIRLYKFVDRSSFLDAKSLKLKRNASRKNSLSFSLTTDGTYLPESGQKVELYDDSTLIFGGYIKRRKIKRIGTATTYKIRIKLECVGHEGLAARRTLDQEWLSTDAGTIAEALVDDYLSGEGITKGTISTGATIDEYPANELNKAQSIKKILDDLAEISGFSWFIDPDRTLHFVLSETVGNAAQDLEDGEAFTSFWDVELDDDLSNYRNKQFVKGGIDDLGNPLIVGSQDYDAAQDRQDIEGGSGVYGHVFENSNLIATTTLIADTGTTTTTVNTTAAHGLEVGDVVVNTDRSNAKRQVLTVPTTTSYTVTAVTGQVSGDEIVTYDDANTIMKRLLQTFKGQKFSFRTTDLDFVPVTKMNVDLADMGISNQEFFIETVEIYDTDGKNLQSYVTASLRDFTDLSTRPIQGWTSFFKKLTDLAEIKNTESIAKFS